VIKDKLVEYVRSDLTKVEALQEARKRLDGLRLHVAAPATSGRARIARRPPLITSTGRTW